MSAFRRRGTRPGRLLSLGQDHTAGHRQYVAALGNDAWLRTKPFSSPPTYELGRCLHSFAHIVDALRLGPGARVLDVGCGPGWLSEFLARCGYAVTGVDVSEDMVRIAEERVGAVNRTIGEANALEAEFVSLPVVELPWRERFDAAVLYDAMHHFHDERETLQAIRRTLLPGGRIYIHEGVRPPEGSDGERELIDEMRRYGTLESPFDPEYLLQVVRDAGFADVRRLVEVDRLVPAGASLREMRHLWSRLRQPETNTVIATNPFADGSLESHGTLAAKLTLVRRAEADGTDEMFRVRVLATNIGTRDWPASPAGAPSPRGTVTVAPFVDVGGRRHEFGRAMLPWSVKPGEAVELDITVRRTDLGSAPELVVDLIAEEIAWFGDLDSAPLRIPT